MTLLVRCRPWTTEVSAPHRVMVEGVDVRVWDPTAGHYTLRHSLPEADIKRIRSEARRLVGH